MTAVALGNMLVFAEHHGADRILLEVQREAEGIARELEHFALHHVREAVDAPMPSVTDTTVP